MKPQDAINLMDSICAQAPLNRETNEQCKFAAQLIANLMNQHVPQEALQNNYEPATEEQKYNAMKEAQEKGEIETAKKAPALDQAEEGENLPGEEANGETVGEALEELAQ